jgi:hypothetical protein
MKKVILISIVMLSGCQFGQTVMISKGEAGGFAQIFSGSADYCKITATDGVALTESDREAFRKYCGELE